MRSQTVMIVDDHAVVREGVRRLLVGLPGIDVIEASTGEAALETQQSRPIDVTILDLNLGGVGGLELLRQILKQSPKARVIVFSMHAEPVYAARALRIGAKGYVSKSAAADELILAVQRVTEGGRYVERELATELATGAYDGEDPRDRLTDRELEILRLLGDGKSMTEIADAMGVSYKTIANSCSLMKGKLGLDRTADLIRTALEIFPR